MHAFHHLDKHLVVLPAFILAINNLCYSMMLEPKFPMQKNNPAHTYTQGELLHARFLWDGKCIGDAEKDTSYNQQLPDRKVTKIPAL